MKNLYLIFFLVFISGCAGRMLDSTIYSTREVTPREQCILNCVRETQSSTEQTRQVGEVQECIRQQKYSLKASEPDLDSLNQWDASPRKDLE